MARLFTLQIGWRASPPDQLASENPELLNLIKECWAQEPKIRPNFAEIQTRFEERLSSQQVKKTKERLLFEERRNKGEEAKTAPGVISVARHTTPKDDDICEENGSEKAKLVAEMATLMMRIEELTGNEEALRASYEKKIKAQKDALEAKAAKETEELIKQKDAEIERLKKERNSGEQ